MSVSVGNSYSEDQLMHTFLDNFHHGGKYSAQIASHQAELRREEKLTDQKYLNIYSSMRIMQKRPSETFFMQTLIYTAED